MVALGALALMQAGVAAGQAIYGNAQRKKAEAAADKSMASMRATVEQGLTNQYAGLQAATQEFELQDQQTQALIAQNAQMLRESGAEGVIGGVGNLVQAGHQSGLQTAAKIEGAEFELDKLEAAEQSRLDQLQQQQLLGLGQQELMGAQAAGQEARQNIYQGIGGITNAMAGLGGFLAQKDLLTQQGDILAQQGNLSTGTQNGLMSWLGSPSSAQTQQGNNLTHGQLIGLIGQAQ